MAAYASLVSLENIIDNLQNHPRPPITLHHQHVHLLTQNITFLQKFLQVYNPSLPYSREADPLECRIARAAYAAEDAIESHISDHLTDNDGEKMSSDSDGLYGALEKVIEDMALIQKEAMSIKDTLGFKNQLQTRSTPPPVDSSGSTSSSSIAQKESSMVGAADMLLAMKDKLTSHSRELQSIPIVGMGGSGKTTLALNVYQDGLIKEHFDLRAWVTISQEYNIKEILIQLLTQLIEKPKEGLSEGELGEMLYKHLFGRRFMIVLDDMWSLEAWDGVKKSLPNNNNGSRVVITTRLTTLASALPNSNNLGMKILDENDSWDLLSKTVFGEKGSCCPSGFENIGKKIGKSCKGLPLSIVVVGGILAKSERTIEFWEKMQENINATVNLDDDERCLRTLYMSYKHLPLHLKPCFLYMGIYREDHEIHIPNLIKLWVAEGFLRPVSGKRPEDVARAYIKDLIDRNLIMIHKLGKTGSIKECKVHDLLRDLCLREAQKQGFYSVYPGHEIRNDVSRIVMSGSIRETEDIYALLSKSTTIPRSLILDLFGKGLPPHISRQRLMIVTSSNGFPEKEDALVNSRYLNLVANTTKILSSIRLFWNLQTLIVNELSSQFTTYRFKYTAPTDIWYMSHIRHLHIRNLYLPHPPNAEDGIVLANLQSLGVMRDFKCSEEVVKRIPNMRKLVISYYGVVDDRFCLNNLDSLEKLETLNCYFYGLKYLNINYPRSLKKLRMEVNTFQYCWEDILDKIGALPLLQKLALERVAFNKGKWETSEGQFRSLKYLSLWYCKGLHVWTSEASHFPRLEQLHLYRLDDLQEFPSDFADISTLRLIDVERCPDSAIESAKRILEEQEASYGEEDTTLQVRVLLTEDNDPALKSLASLNFHVRKL